MATILKFLKLLKRWLSLLGTAVGRSRRRTERPRANSEAQKNIYPLW